MKKVLVFVALACVFLCSCSEYFTVGYEFDPGQTLSPEMISSIFEAEEETEKPTVKITEETEVFFTEGGSKFHLFSDCSTLSRTKNVLSAKFAEAKEKGKGECCSHCAKKAGTVEILP